MSGRFLGYDPAYGLTEAFHVDNEVKFVIETAQDVEAIIDNNKRLANDNDGYSPSRELRRIAAIPLVIVEKWRNELGVNIFNKDHEPKVRALLNDPDWRYLRTSPGRY
jgi:hypothetical protein